MTVRTPIIFNPTTQRLEELGVNETIAGTDVEWFMGRNRFINGDLNWWQRRTTGRVGSGAGTIGASAYFADRFVCAALNGSQDIARMGYYDVVSLGYPQNMFAVQRHTLSGITNASGVWFGQMIEDIRRTHGQMTISFWAHADQAGRSVGLRVIQQFGSGGSPSPSVSNEAGLVTLSTVPTRYSVTVNIPNIAGKTFGTNGDDNVYIVFDLCSTLYPATTGQSGTFYFTGFQIEAGSKATDFEWRHPALELAKCQRYYEISGGIATSDGSFFSSHYYKVAKRATPNLIVLSGNVAPATLNPRGNSGFFSMDGRASSSNAFTVAIDAEFP
ncbi:hypothetical protein BA766_20315 [Stenotrophomonas maltophilia]|uniref:hypothetical protein n=1 Tax=Stenotrophomonas maltophilia TaxID=40324 RepID=UPI000810E11E|nr:hypothetical protein [Stenotrophomonas maltophilia]OCK48374.1 hypothetical protein BA766_20315 [Stenotrophomonas maltophilia]